MVLNRSLEHLVRETESEVGGGGKDREGERKGRKGRKEGKGGRRGKGGRERAEKRRKSGKQHKSRLQ